jgi:hypothetical protein
MLRHKKGRSCGPQQGKGPNPKTEKPGTMANMYRESCAYKMRFLPCSDSGLYQKMNENDGAWREYAQEVQPELFKYVEKHGWNQTEYEKRREKGFKENEDSELEEEVLRDSGDDEYNESPKIDAEINACIEQVCSKDAQEVMKQCVRSSSYASWEDVDDLRSLDINSKICSPVGLPRFLSLDMSFHNRARCYSVEFFFVVHFRFEEFPRKKRTHEAGGGYLEYEPPHDEILCSNEYMDCPDVGDADASLHLWTRVENPRAPSLTPRNVRKMRLWLFGDSQKSYEYISDKGLLQLVFASVGVGVCGTRGYLGSMSMGHTSAGISWLDHAVSLATGDLTEEDREYEPYDQQAAKTEWGMQANEVHEDNYEELQDRRREKRRRKKAKEAAAMKAKGQGTTTNGETKHHEEYDEEYQEDEDEDIRLDPAALWDLFEKRQMPARWINGEPYSEPFQTLRQARAMGMGGNGPGDCSLQ